MHTFDRVRDGDDYLWVVGWTDFAGNWHPLRDCKSASEAARWVSYLNGGERPAQDW
ncbi:MAG TPA: hypothetical protein VFI48_11485 [Hyphomicrobiaceae bacterium]|nr:hypothetical protein [Hyphomicrobiaceae bacterium]